MSDALRAENSALCDVLFKNGFRRCDVPACNCGAGHHRFGLPERMAEIKDALADAGHPLTNDNGNKLLNALAGLVSERDALLEALTEVRDRLVQHPEYAQLTEDEEQDIGGDTAEFSYLVRVATAAIDAARAAQEGTK